MKKYFLYFLLCLTPILVGCDGNSFPNDDDNENHENEQQEMELLSSDQQKDLLVEVGEELINTFNPNDQKEAVDLANNLYYKYEHYDWDAIMEEFEEEYDDIYSTEFESFFGMPRRIIELIYTKQNATAEDLNILLTLSKFGRIIEFDDSNKSVKITRTNDASIIAKFSDSKNVNCELKVWGESKEIEGSYTYEDYHWEYPQIWDEYWQEWVPDWENGEKVSDGKRTIRVKVPTTIKMHLKHGSNSLVECTLEWDSNLKDYVNHSLKLKVTNLEFEEEVKASTKEASAVFTFIVGGKNIITGAANLPKYSLIGWEGGSDVTEDEGLDWLEEYEDKYASLLGKLGKGDLKLNILNKLQIVGGFTDGAALVDAYYNWDDKYSNYNWDDYQRTYTYTVNYTYWDYWYDEYGNWYDGYKTDTWEEEDTYNAWWERPYYSLEAKQAQCEFLNKYAHLSVYYNNTKTEQAKLLMDTYEENGTYDPAEWLRYENSWNGSYSYTNLPDPIQYTRYEIEPIMYFPKEETGIAVMTYFNSSKFLGLIDLVEDLANSYIKLDKDHLIFGEDFKIEIDY